MEQTNKDLLISDLCGRVPYGVKIEVTWWCMGEGVSIETTLDPDHIQQLLDDCDGDIEIMPFLRPISDMTTEECERLFEILHIDENRGDWLKINDIGIIRLMTENGKDFYEIAQAMYYLNSIHVDYNELIDKGLAKKASEGMYVFSKSEQL